MSDPAIIYNRTSDEILAANNPLFLLTHLVDEDFIGHSLKALLPNLSDTDPITGHGQITRLRHKNQPLIPVSVRIFSLSKSNKNILLILSPESSQKQREEALVDHTEFIEKLHELIRSKNHKDIKSSLKQVLRTAKDLLSADLISIYKASGTRPQLVQYLSNDKNLSGELPNILTSEELVNDNLPFLWTPGKPALSHIQNTAASANFQYLALAPLGQREARFGLLVAGSKKAKPDSNTLPLLSLLADFITGMMENHIALHNAKNMVGKVKQVVKIQNEIIANLDEGILILSPDLTIAEINPAAESILGYANIEALRQNIESILIGSESLGSAFSSARQGIPTLVGGDLTLHHRNGKSFPAQVMTIPVLSDGALLSIIILLRDMSQTEQTRAANKQLEQRAILGEVTAIFAHEVRNPINAINLAIQVMEENIEPDDLNAKWMEKIRGECNQLTHLMESVLSFAKPLEYKMGEADLGFMLPRLLERWRPRLRRLNITHFFETEVENPIVEGDIRALEQVFTNLISNAVNAMSEKGGYLGIKIAQPGNKADQNYLEIIITDNGPGIPADIMEHIFEPFVTGSYNGTGLGLAITQRIINAHKGRIEVESFPGGTIFKVYLMRKKEKPHI
jgi:PAS domain S-box-containing protein